VTLMRIMSGAPIHEAAMLMLRAGITAHEAKELVSQALVIAALEQAGGNLCKAASLMDVHRNTLSRQLLKLRLEHLPWEIRRQRGVQGQLKFSKGRGGRPPRVKAAAA
jgi:regulatory Fis family protein